MESCVCCNFSFLATFFSEVMTGQSPVVSHLILLSQTLYTYFLGNSTAFTSLITCILRHRNYWSSVMSAVRGKKYVQQSLKIQTPSIANTMCKSYQLSLKYSLMASGASLHFHLSNLCLLIFLTSWSYKGFCSLTLP